MATNETPESLWRGISPGPLTFTFGNLLDATSKVRTNGSTISVGCKDIVLYPEAGRVKIEFSRKKTARVTPADLRSIAAALRAAADKAEALADEREGKEPASAETLAAAAETAAEIQREYAVPAPPPPRSEPG
jgi:hypothetical protein